MITNNQFNDLVSQINQAFQDQKDRIGALEQAVKTLQEAKPNVNKKKARPKAS